MSFPLASGLRGNHQAAKHCLGETLRNGVWRPPPAMLVIDDDENDEILLRRAFDFVEGSLPLQVVKDGEQAISYLNGDGQYADRSRYPLPTLILLDLKMPGLNGFDVLRWLQSHPDYLRVPVVVLSGSMWPGDIDEAYRLGANSYLVKPARRQELEEIARMATTYWFHMNLGSSSETRFNGQSVKTAQKPIIETVVRNSSAGE